MALDQTCFEFRLGLLGFGLVDVAVSIDGERSYFLILFPGRMNPCF